jgi:hypothetical protein
MATILFSVNYAPAVEVSFNRLMQVPPIVTCPVFNVPPFIGPNLDQGWNCQRCGSDALFLNAYRTGDIIPMQLATFDPANPDPINPVIGFKDTGTGAVAGVDFYVRLELYDTDCTTVLSDDADDICSDYWVGFSNDVGPIQTFFLDTSLPVFSTLSGDMFRVKLSTYNVIGSLIQETWTEVFRLEECLPTVRFQSQHKNSDCLGHDYTLPTTAIVGPTVPPTGSPTAFFMAWRWRGELIEVGTTDEREENDNNDLLSLKQRRLFQIVFRNIPPYSKRIFDAIKSVSDVQIQRGSDAFEVYQEFGDVAKNIESGNRMFKIVTTCVQICTVNEFDCDD